MCGFAGYAGLQGLSIDAHTQALAKMGAAIQERGPDDQGVEFLPAQNIGLVHRRLAIQDLSPLGHQPMHSACGRYTTVFNGEIYNFKALREQLLGQGFTFISHSDTEVALAAFVHWGVEAALQQFTGMFAFAIVDREENALYLVRDRLGEKPLYYYQAGSALIFGSDLKALMVAPGFIKAIDPASMPLYLRHNYVPAPHTIFKHTYKLLPAHYLRFDLNNLAAVPIAQRYWSPGLQWNTAWQRDSLRQQLESLLDSVIADQMISDAPLGAFLSGGVDSSLVVALMQKNAMQPVKTFSLGFSVPGYNEAQYAAQVASHLKTHHTEYYVSPEDALAIIPELPNIYSEPFADSSQIPTFIVSRLTRQAVTVALSGDGGDELFAGYTRYHNPAYGQRRLSRQLAAKVLKAAPRGLVHQLIKRAKPAYRPLSAELIDDRIDRFLQTSDSSSLQQQYFNSIAFWHRPEQVLQQPTGYELPSYPQRQDPIAGLQWLDINNYLPDDILVKVDRAAMHASLETRVPLLDHRVVELALSVPTHLNVAGGSPKTPLRDILYQYVPQALIERPKQGFAIPKAEWLRGALRDWAEDLLSQAALEQSGLFRPALIRAKWYAHVQGHWDYAFELWSILMFQSWYRHTMQDSPD